MGGEKVSDGCSLERSKGWMEEGGTEAPQVRSGRESREKLEELMNERVKGWQGMDDNVKVTVVMDRACRDEDVGRAVERMWQRHFAAHGPHPSRN